MDRTIKAHIALFIANLIYAANYTIAKEAMPAYVMPFGFILLRVSGAFILFWSVHAFMPKERITNRDLLRLAVCAVFGVAINQLLFFKGLSITTPINASIIMTINPVMVLIFAAIIIKESINIRKVIGIITGLIGAVLLITNNGEFSFSNQTSIGDGLVFINATSYGLYLVLVKPLMDKYSAFTIIKWVFLFGFIYVLPFGLEEVLHVDWANMPYNIFLAVGFVVVFTTFFAYLLNILALKELSPSIVSYYIYLQPVLATVIALSFEKDVITFEKGIAALFIFLGVFLISYSSKKTD